MFLLNLNVYSKDQLIQEWNCKENKPLHNNFEDIPVSYMCLWKIMPVFYLLHSFLRLITDLLLLSICD